MEKNRVLITAISKIVINCIMAVLCFIKIIQEVAVLPGFDENGEEITAREDYFFSVYEKLSGVGLSFLLWAALAIIVASVILSVLCIVIKDNKKLSIASRIVFGPSICMFLIAFLTARLIWYNY
ncbi:MAG: hypothetical protein K2K80_07530 [Clostridia bacterium]|nr:hypothetical protein [Clostridia bacterium]